ncbi:MAG: hypothetical protein IJG80_02850 [Selenomonadaceae bacterium]|nr:hypothetical protein [Selenomonadaceae bacterium]MBQ3433998.1 hypothetical protein [Selenomonadaceae bacterium]
MTPLDYLKRDFEFVDKILMHAEAMSLRSTLILEEDVYYMLCLLYRRMHKQIAEFEASSGDKD